MITCIEYFLLCAFTVILLLTNNTPTSIALGYCTAGMATLLCNVFIFGRKYNIPRIWKDNRNRQLQKEIIKYSVPLVLTSLGGACTCGNGHVYARTVLSETTGFCLFHCKTTDIKSDKCKHGSLDWHNNLPGSNNPE